MTDLYSEIRSKIKTGDLIATDEAPIDSFFGLVLSLYQKILGAKYTHVGVAVRMGGRVFVVEATPPEVRLVPISMFGDFKLIQTEMKDNENAQLEFLFASLGKKYSIFDMLKGTLGITGDNSDYYCSELAGDFYNSFGYITDRKAGHSPDSIVEAVLEKAKVEPILVAIDKGNLK